MRVARRFFRMGEHVANEAPKRLIFLRGGLESIAKGGPGGLRVERQARLGRRDGYNEAWTEPLAEPRGHDEAPLVVKGVLDRTGKAR